MSYEDIKKLIDDMGNSRVDELKIEFPEGMKIEIRKNCGSVSNFDTTVSNENGVADNKISIKKEEESYKIVKSPMVGTFYGKPSPNAEAFVKVGDKVKKGQVVCIVEAMKLMNEIESEFDGEVVEICCKDETMVEYGAQLIKIK